MRTRLETEDVFALHRGGKLRVEPRVPINDADDLSLAYTPGVAHVCLAVADDPDKAFDYTWKGNSVAIVTDGTAVLGLGDIGPYAALPVLEGKAAIFQRFAGIDAVPICLDTTDVDRLVEAIAALAPGFGGINLEDISAPRCFEVEAALRRRLDIPVFHDDQHGTAIVVLAGLLNVCRLTGRDLGALRVVVSGAGAAGVAITELLLDAGIGDIAVADRGGILSPDRDGLTDVKRRLAEKTNLLGVTGSREAALAGADVFIGVSGGTLSEESVASMARDAAVFALANPDPEILPEVAARHVRVVATGRSDHPNQINNSLVFPGLFRGLLDGRVKKINRPMTIAAANAIAGLVGDDLDERHIVPSMFDPRVVRAVARAVAEAAAVTAR
jgi:malate dehydrogenase (oxaloacetate-decarboxylating)